MKILQHVAVITPNDLLASLCEIALTHLQLQSSHHLHVHPPILKEGLDAVLLDVDAHPIESNLAMLKQWIGSTPLIALTHTIEAHKRWDLLQRGFHDYLMLPFAVEELQSKLKSLLLHQTNPKVRLGEWMFDADACELKHMSGRSVRLAPSEQALLMALVQVSGRVCSPSTLMQRMHEQGVICQPNTVPVVVSKLRKVIEADPAHPCYLLTVKGQGYQLVT